ncbi:hypothetical protein M758_4G231100 [Ceratodon purpureus]|nr:hypothetical protein M758_4G231100 [Ceratodon purpureus]
MRIPERAHWAAWRLYLSLSQNGVSVRPLSSFHYQVDLVGARRGYDWGRGVVCKEVLVSPLRQFLGASGRSRGVLSDVCPLLRFPYSTERDVGRVDGKGVISEEEKSSGSNARSENGDNFQGECSPSLPVGSHGVGGSGWSKEEVVNWPNAISMGRLLSGPLLAWMIANGMAKPALVGLLLAGGSDWLDGYMARRQGINSVLGSYLDPLADKVLVGCIAVSMAYSGLLHPGLVALIVARDGVLLVGSFVYRAYTLRWKWSGLGEFFKIGAGGVEKVEPLYISKVNMVLQLGLIGTALVLPAMEIQDTYSIIPILSWSVVATTSASWIGYAWVYLRRPTPAAGAGGLMQVSRKVEKS